MPFLNQALLRVLGSKQSSALMDLRFCRGETNNKQLSKCTRVGCDKLYVEQKSRVRGFWAVVAGVLRVVKKIFSNEKPEWGQRPEGGEGASRRRV